MNILVIDSNANTLYRIKKLLEDFPAEVYTASTAKEALHRIQFKNHIIMIDINLGVDDGFDIIQKINEHNNGAIIVIITSTNTRRAFVKGLRLGASDYILKPFDDNYFLYKVSKHIKSANKSQNNDMEQSIYKHIERAIKKKTELLVGLVVVYNHNNPTQIVANMPIVKGLFSRFKQMSEFGATNIHGIKYSGETGRQGANGYLIILDDIKRGDKEYVVSDFRNVSDTMLEGSEFSYELDFMSIPYELKGNEKILSVLSRRIEENIDMEE